GSTQHLVGVCVNPIGMVEAKADGTFDRLTKCAYKKGKPVCDRHGITPVFAGTGAVVAQTDILQREV
ncbi:MAG: hypothetical protein WCF85_12865, partial [Rhodospirillaceae bacterium]